MYNIVILVAVIGLIIVLQNKSILEKIKFKKNKDFIVLGLILVYILINRTLISLIIGVILGLFFYHKTILKFIKNKNLLVEKFESIKNQIIDITPKPRKENDNQIDIFADLEKFKKMSNKLLPHNEEKKTEPFKNKVRKIKALFKQLKEDINS